MTYVTVTAAKRITGGWPQCPPCVPTSRGRTCCTLRFGVGGRRRRSRTSPAARRPARSRPRPAAWRRCPAGRRRPLLACSRWGRRTAPRGGTNWRCDLRRPLKEQIRIVLVFSVTSVSGCARVEVWRMRNVTYSCLLRQACTTQEARGANYLIFVVVWKKFCNNSLLYIRSRAIAKCSVIAKALAGRMRPSACMLCCPVPRRQTHREKWLGWGEVLREFSPHPKKASQDAFISAYAIGSPLVLITFLK